MVIGEQLNLQQQPQQQIATTTSGPTTQQLAPSNQQQQLLTGNSTHNLSDQSATNNIGVSNNKSSANNIPCNNNNNINNIIGNGGGALVGGSNSATATKNQLEQLNTMREALFSQDGWGCQHVNQDTNWEVPNTPPPTDKDSTAGPPLWKPAINNGTDLWESNLRNGGQPSSQPIQKTPWGHTPSSNLGGTWGEDDDGTDSGSVWTGSGNNPTAPGNVSVAGVGTPVVVAGAHTNGPQWGQSGVGVGGSGNATNNPPVGVMTSGATNLTAANVTSGAGTGVAGTTTGNSWGDHREIRNTGPMNNPIDMRSVDPRDPMRAGSAGDPRDMRMIDPRDPIRGDPRGISGRLNGTSEMWGSHHPIAHNQIPTMNKMVGPGLGNGGNVTGAVVPGAGVGIGPAIGTINQSSGVSGNVNAQWGTAQNVVGPKDIASMSSKQVSGWEEPSPPTQRRNIPNYDDGTSLWGQQSRVPGGSHWKDMNDRNHLIRNSMGAQNPTNANVVAALGGSSGSAIGNNQTTGMGTPGNVGVNGNQNNVIGGVGPQGRLATPVGPSPSVGGQHKTDNAMWVHPNNANVTGRSTSWADDNGHNVSGTSGPNWVDDKPVSGIGQIGANLGTGGNSWNDSPANWNKNQTKMTGGSTGWGGSSTNDVNDLGADWASHGKPQQKLGGGLNSETIKLTKQYRILIETGFKKDDVERALLSTNLNLEEAAELLRTNASMGMDGWRRHDETLGSYADHSNPTTGGYPGRYPASGSQPTLSYPTNNHILNSMGNPVGLGNNNPNLNSMQTPQVQKYLNQGPHNLAAGPQSVNSPALGFGQGANVTAAVNVGSNSNIQPSAQQLRMLVQQIQLAVHSGYLSSQILNQPLAPATLILLNQLLSNIKHLQGAQQQVARGNNALQLNVAINKYKQQIQTLQTQINAQQAIYVKQQSMQQNPQHPISHLNNPNTEYLRGQHDAINALQGNFTEMNLNKQTSNYAVASNPQSRLNQWKLPVLDKDLSTDNTDFSRAPGATKQVNTNNMGSLGLQNDGTWSTGRNLGDGWPDPSNENENKDWSVAHATTYTDLVQEFEPGKPWKGSQIKSIEDDPSITPGSVARSPLSINPTPKEADIFSNTSKNSPTELPPLSLSSNTWSFNPSSNNQNFSSWSDNSQQSEIWGATPMNKSRGPPPGLGSNKSGGVNVNNVPNASSVVSGNSNGWLGRNVSNANNSWSGTNSSWNSNWLLLKNLNSQIDGSTLRTLCMQHGPLLNFHLYLNQGIALCKYATREEANKAQMTLNNCVLGNTTICAESPSDNEVQGILQHLPQTANSSGPAVGGGVGGNGANSSANSSGNNGNNSSGNGGGVGNNGNNSISNNSVVNGTGNGGSNAPNVPSNAPNGIGQPVSISCNNPNSGGGGNNANTNNGPGGNGNNSAGGNNGSAWRQPQNQQSQSRPTGREADFDYLSKFVVSIVDD